MPRGYMNLGFEVNQPQAQGPDIIQQVKDWDKWFRNDIYITLRSEAEMLSLMDLLWLRDYGLQALSRSSTISNAVSEVMTTVHRRFPTCAFNIVGDEQLDEMDQRLTTQSVAQHGPLRRVAQREPLELQGVQMEEPETFNGALTYRCLIPTMKNMYDLGGG